MEYVDGKTLDEIEAPEMGQLVLIFSQVASALTHMHRRGRLPRRPEAVATSCCRRTARSN